MSTKINVVRGPEFERIVLQNDTLRVVILPELGGKIASLVNLSTGREFFLQHSDRPYQRAAYGADFGQSDISGFDECLPTISACLYPEAPFAGKAMPDHGEVWSLPWTYQIHDQELVLEVTGMCLPYVFRRRTRLNGSMVELVYEMTNTGDQAFRYLWSAHPLLIVETGAEIVLPPSISEMLVDYSAAARLVVGKTVKWPQAVAANGTQAHLNQISGPQQRTADKLFTSRLSEGYCGLRFPRTQEKIFFHFDPREIPFLGLWICQGGYPNEGTPEFTVALEPCTGRPDSLVKAIANNECSEISAHSTQSWWLNIEL